MSDRSPLHDIEALFGALPIGACVLDRELRYVRANARYAESVGARAGELAGQMAGHAPLTMRATKEALRRLRTDGPHTDASDLIVECYMSADFKKGIEAFLGKRKPEWKGK